MLVFPISNYVYGWPKYSGNVPGVRGGGRLFARPMWLLWMTFIYAVMIHTHTHTWKKNGISPAKFPFCGLFGLSDPRPTFFASTAWHRLLRSFGRPLALFLSFSHLFHWKPTQLVCSVCSSVMFMIMLDLWRFRIGNANVINAHLIIISYIVISNK